MKSCDLQLILARAVESMGQPSPNHYWSVLPEAKVVTGNPVYDAQLHHVLIEYGVEVKLDKDYNMKDYRVIDEQKFTMFLLRWA
jgi:hypothetical protein